MEIWIIEIAALIANGIEEVCQIDICKVIRRLLPVHVQRELPTDTVVKEVEGLVDSIANTQFPGLDYVVECAQDLLNFKEADSSNIAVVLSKKLDKYMRAIERRKIFKLPWTLIFAAIRNVLSPEHVQILENPAFGSLMRRSRVISSGAQRGWN